MKSRMVPVARWGYALAIAVLASRIEGLLLFYVSDVWNWYWYVFVAGWFVLFFVAIWEAVRLRWRELAALLLVLALTAAPAFRIGEEFIARVRVGAYRLYAEYRIQSVPLDRFLRNCDMYDYADADRTKREVGFCNNMSSAMVWEFPCVIYDPSGNFIMPEPDRDQAWESTVRHNMPAGPFLAYHDHNGAHLVGDFYFALVPVEELVSASRACEQRANAKMASAAADIQHVSLGCHFGKAST